MNSKPVSPRSFRFPWVGFGVGILIGALLVGVFGSLGGEQSDGKELALPDASEGLSNPATIAPNPEWSPEEVVQRQMEALIASNTDPEAIANCFALASPSNRLVTGPLERFAAMVAGPNYRALLEARTFLVGKAIQQDRFAAVLVTLMTHEGQPYAYRFLLSQQTGELAGSTDSTGDDHNRWQDCWMTDGVSRVSPPEASPRLPGPDA